MEIGETFKLTKVMRSDMRGFCLKMINYDIVVFIKIKRKVSEMSGNLKR